MAYAGFLRTLPIPTATLSGFVCLLNAGWFTQADANALDGTTFINGGGSLRIYTDATKTTQLPLEVVTFVTGGTPEVQAWIRIPTYTGAATTVWVESDAVAIAQPAFSDTYGRNAVWSDYEAVIHASEAGTDGVFVDSTGNGLDTTLTTGATLSTTTSNPLGGSWPVFAEALTLTNSAQVLNTSPASMSAWVNYVESSDNKGLIGNRYSAPDVEWFALQQSKRAFISSAGATDFISGGPLSTGVNHLVAAVYDSTSLITYSDGVQVGIDSAITVIDGIETPAGRDYRVGTYYDDATSRRLNGNACEFRLFRFKQSLASVDTEYLNQSNASTFGTSSGWTTGGGGGFQSAWARNSNYMIQ
jgi:hypothetical protein